jgi:hypothetical protein
MRQRISKLGGSKRRRRFLLGTIASAAVLAVALISSALAVHDDNLFELGPGVVSDEGGVTNILGDGIAANGPDWADLFDANGDPVGPAGVAKAFIEDPNSLKGAADPTTFSGAGGSNKNNDAISGAGDTWHWDAGNVPAKDDLTNLYSYATLPTTGALANHLILYSGLERLDPNGDSHVDLEFFQDDVALDETAPCNDAGPDTTPCEFTGTRTVGDFIVSMDFETGGTIGTVEIRRWNGTEYASVVALGGEGCNAADSVCAFNNADTIDGGPWPNFVAPSGNVVTTLEQNAFTEFGVDLTALFDDPNVPGDQTPCVSTFMGKTRSSSSFTAELKDFGGPTSFDVCQSKSGVKFNDLDADGTRDAGEPGLPNWRINLYKDTGTIGSYDGEQVFAFRDTDANGAYSFASLFPGSYIVCEVLQATWNQSAPTSAPQGETLVTNCPGLNGGTTNGYAFTVGSSDFSSNNFGNFQRGALRILKNSTKTDTRVLKAGAVFSYGPVGGSTTSVTDDTTTAAPDEDADIGEVCVSGLLPGQYSVDETAAPPGYGGDPGGAQTVTVVGGTDCTPPDNLPGAGATATFTNPPLADVQMRFRDGGSGETFLVDSAGNTPGTITCNNVTGSTSNADTDGWADTTTVTGIEIGANVVTVVCTARIDP